MGSEAPPPSPRQIQTLAPELPVLVITAHSSFDVIAKAFRHKIEGYVAQPFVEQEEIFTRVRSTLKLKAAAAKNAGK